MQIWVINSFYNCKLSIYLGRSNYRMEVMKRVTPQSYYTKGSIFLKIFSGIVTTAKCTYKTLVKNQFILKNNKSIYSL